MGRKQKSNSVQLSNNKTSGNDTEIIYFYNLTNDTIHTNKVQIKYSVVRTMVIARSKTNLPMTFAKKYQ